MRRTRPEPHQLRPARLAVLALNFAPARFAALALMVAGALFAGLGSQALAARGTPLPSRQRHPGFHKGVASWYRDDGLKTACGFHAHFGVANRTLPCHTKVTFWRGTHRVVATVDDRGPYTPGRTWDLDEHTARALDVTGVAPVWAKW